MKTLTCTFCCIFFSLLTLGFTQTPLVETIPVQVPRIAAPTETPHNSAYFSYLNDVSIMITNDLGHGSGTLITRKIKIDGKEKEYNFVLTCGHVVERLVKDGVMDDSSLFGHQPIIMLNRMVGVSKFKLKVIKWDGQFGDDIAILLVEKEVITKSGAKFLTKKFQPVGTEVWHVGSPKNKEFPNVILHGYVSSIGRTILDEVYDSVQAGASQGSSGGGVFNTQGEYVGMVCRTVDESNNFIVPIRRIKSWLNKEKLGWLVDTTQKVPENLEDVL